MFLRFVGLLFAAVCGPSLCHAGYGFDVGIPPAVHAGHLAEAKIGGAQGTWMRVRGVMDRERVKESETRTVAADRAGLRALRDRGIRTAVFLRWSPDSWRGGVRSGGGHRMPLDLREAYERGRWLGETYGDLVDAWEIDNEPDIGYGPDNPETYAAFLKAVYLGLKSGAASAFQPDSSNKVKFKERSAKSTWLTQKRGWSDLQLNLSSSTRGAITTSRVVMAPLAIPPGPYLERLWANGLPSYTDGFNFHYYGYAEDFTGVYRQFEDAVERLGAERRAVEVEDEGLRDGVGLDLVSSRAGGSASREVRPYQKALPVFITEYGYGLLDAHARNTVEGRVRQWRWFADVVKQVRALQIEAPMAFYWNPYYEANWNEFGLTTQTASRFKPLEIGDQPSVATSTFTPVDFGEKRAKPWMDRIGKKVGEAYASPALAYLWDYAEKKPYRPRHWRVSAAPASPVVIDFIPSDELVQVKNSGGYVLAPKDDTSRGGGHVVLYNFSEQVVSGRLGWTGARIEVTGLSGTVALAPGERREVDVSLAVPADAFVAQAWRLTFTPAQRDISPAVFATNLFPSSQGMLLGRVRRFAFEAEETVANRKELLSRPLAVGESALREQGRWLVTEGVRVEEIGDLWRFYIDYLPAEPFWPAAVELPLPVGFVFPADALVFLERRRVAATRALGSNSTVAGNSRAGRAGDTMDVCFRTENGNLYRTWPRLRANPEWTSHLERMDDFTMGFFGRAKLPWRFYENRPASLVFFLRPSELPAIFEVRDARIVRFEKSQVGRKTEARN